MEDNFLKYYSKILDESGGHLTNESIARYLNSHELLSSKENDFIEKHLQSCGKCYEKYQTIFDEDFEFDDEAICFDELNLKKNRDNFYQITNNEFEIVIYKKEIENVLVFNSLSRKVQNSRIRILSGDKVILRVTGVHPKVEYQLNHIDQALPGTEKLRLEYLPAVIQKKTDSKSFNISYYWYAAAALILVAVGLAYFLPKESINPKNKNREIVNDTVAINNRIVQNDSVEIPIKKNNEELIAYNLSDFEENGVLENFIDRNIRSSSALKIISPGIGDTIKIPHIFKWEKMDSASEYSVIILSNKNLQKAALNTSKNSIQISKEISPGLYYWKIEANGKLQAFGKFFIK